MLRSVIKFSLSLYTFSRYLRGLNTKMFQWLMNQSFIKYLSYKSTVDRHKVLFFMECDVLGNVGGVINATKQRHDGFPLHFLLPHILFLRMLPSPFPSLFYLSTFLLLYLHIPLSSVIVFVQLIFSFSCFCLFHLLVPIPSFCSSDSVVYLFFCFI